MLCHNTIPHIFLITTQVQIMVLVSEMVLISAMSADSCKLLSLVIRMGHK